MRARVLAAAGVLLGGLSAAAPAQALVVIDFTLQLTSFQSESANGMVFPALSAGDTMVVRVSFDETAEELVFEGADFVQPLDSMTLFPDLADPILITQDMFPDEESIFARGVNLDEEADPPSSILQIVGLQLNGGEFASFSLISAESETEVFAENWRELLRLGDDVAGQAQFFLGWGPWDDQAGSYDFHS